MFPWQKEKISQNPTVRAERERRPDHIDLAMTGTGSDDDENLELWDPTQTATEIDKFEQRLLSSSSNNRQCDSDSD